MELLERNAPLRELETALKDAATGEGRVVLVSGEAGIGKTSLVERFTRDHRESARVLWGACDALFTPRPLGPLHDIARQIEGPLIQLLESEATRNVLFSACLSELQREVAIVMIEDVHWADEATLDLLKYLGRRIQRTRALLIVTYRDDEIGPQHPLRIVLGDLATSMASRRIALAPLSEKAVCTLVADKPFDPTALHRRTNGNPFFVTEVLASGASGIPATVRDAVLARLARLSRPARAVLEAAAVIGSRIEPWLLSEVAHVKAACTDECISAGILQVQNEGLAFRHELARQTILDAMSPQQKMVLHRVTLAALKSSPAARDDQARLAHHAEGANDYEAVLECAPSAARQAAAANAHREAAVLYKLALRFAEALPPDGRALMLEAYVSELFFQNQIAEVILALKKTIELWHTVGNRLREGLNLSELAVSFLNMGQHTECEAASLAAIAILEALPPSVELARAYTYRCYINMMHRDCVEAIAWGEKAIAMAERFEDTETLARACNYMGCAALIADYKRGLAIFERSLSIAREENLPFAIAGTLGNLGALLLEVHDTTLASHYLAEGIAYTAEHDDDYHRLEMEAWLALAHLYQGRWMEAKETALQVLKIPHLYLVTQTGALFALGRLLVRQGDTSAHTLLDEALAVSIQADSPRFDSPRLLQAEAACLAGDYARVLAETNTAYEIVVRKQHPWVAGELAFWRWWAGEKKPPPTWIARPFALQIAGDWRGAAQEWERRRYPYEQALALMDGDDAAQREALGIFERLGARPAAALVRQKLRAAGARSIPRGPRPATRENPFGLTARELEILAQVAGGLRNTQIAARLHLSPRTVDHHVAAVLAKLNVPSREAAVRLAVERGLLL